MAVVNVGECRQSLLLGEPSLVQDRERRGECLCHGLHVLHTAGLLLVCVEAHHGPEVARLGVTEPVEAGPGPGQEEPAGQGLRADHSH